MGFKLSDLDPTKSVKNVVSKVVGEIEDNKDLIIDVALLGIIPAALNDNDKKQQEALDAAEKLQVDAAAEFEENLNDWTESGRQAQRAIDRGIYETDEDGNFILEGEIKDDDGNVTTEGTRKLKGYIDDDGNFVAKSDFDQKKFSPEAFKSPDFERLSTFTPPAEFKAPKFTQAEFKAPTAENLKDDPGYQFRVEQGIKARDRSASSRGNLNSGAQQKAIERFAQGSASQEYGNAYARAQNDFAREHGINTQDFARDYGIEANRYNLQLNKENDRYGRVIDEENNLYAREANEYNTESIRLNNQYNALNGLSVNGQNAATQVGTNNVNLANNQANLEIARAQSKVDRNSGYVDLATNGFSNWLTYKGVGGFSGGSGGSGGGVGGNSLNAQRLANANALNRYEGPAPVAGVSLSNSDQRKNYFA